MKRFIHFAAVIMTCLLGATCLSSCQNDDEDVDIKKEKDDSYINLLKSVKADDYELCYEYDDKGRVTSFISKMKSSFYEETHDAVYTYDDIRHLVSITDTWRHHYFDDNTYGVIPEISVNITVYLDSVYNRVDSIVEKNSTFPSYGKTSKFVRYFKYDSDNHLVGISYNWYTKQQQIDWEQGDIVNGINQDGPISFTPSAISNTCPSIDSRNSFLTILDKPLLMAGLFGIAPKHLEQYHSDEWYTCTYDYTTDSGKVISVGITLTNSEQVIEKSLEAYTWQ